LGDDSLSHGEFVDQRHAIVQHQRQPHYNEEEIEYEDDQEYQEEENQSIEYNDNNPDEVFERSAKIPRTP